ncbi:TPA: FKBP-type peptidyl-prolyl cis-trans isomerase [Salmonella enterica subsp. enterica serovar Mississippi]|nr:peptidylprolyl isomerase [Salmonella enterica subsp. enterica]ECW0788952.1 peptidylprolyl isomerase [Salmonella enterica subsp. enterica]HED0168013.1 FKBP-type peptidyl-prolyl cis-trans isomerase [Salmonella enterica subsp. enterica serovar Mississippi]HED0173877.1 FKBP-type peptidyl-prolyl cis-trans isomerase [Salmonella enterica subsp. enterica serovar Mississippi]HED0195872.1 FKBP-type peptidyl-prolyl cis-trans isomerase [Salmonella enterica subsp. enterica serovar Mississippi]
MLAGVGGVHAAGDNRVSTSDEGMPGVLKYAQQYQREKNASYADQKKQVSPESGGITGNTELRRRLTLREQELRQLKRENQSLRDRLNIVPVMGKKEEKNRDKDRQIAELKTALDGRKKQRDELVRQAEETQGALSRQIIELKQQLARADADNKTTTEQAGKEKAELMSSLNALKKEMADMPVVTPELLKTESVQLIYAAGVMLGRDMLNLQSVQQQLGLRTDNRVLLAGVRDALNRKVLLNEAALDSALHKVDEVTRNARQVVIREQKKAGSAYVEKFRKQKGVKQAESGFWYRTEYIGDGDYILGEDTLVDVVVTEKLTDGTVVEDMDAQGRVISQVLSEYPPVFREALMLMKNHGTTELVVPPELAYGDEGYPPKVPPGATMLYILRVEGVKPVAEDVPGTSPLAGKKTTAKRSEGDNK